MTDVYLLAADADSEVTVGSDTKKLAGWSAGSTATLSNKNPVNGPTSGIQYTDSTVAATDGNPMSWYSKPLEAVTVAGQIVASIWGRENSSSANSAPCIKVERCAGDGTVLSTIVALTPSQGASEWSSTTGGASKTLTITAANVTDTALSDGDRLRISVWIDDASDQGGSGTMGAAAGRNTNIWYNGPNGAQGQSRIAFTETLTEYVSGETYSVDGSASNTSHGDGFLGLIALVSGSASAASQGDGSVSIITGGQILDIYGTSTLPAAASAVLLAFGDPQINASNSDETWKRFANMAELISDTAGDMVVCCGDCTEAGSTAWGYFQTGIDVTGTQGDLLPRVKATPGGHDHDYSWPYYYSGDGSTWAGWGTAAGPDSDHCYFSTDLDNGWHVIFLDDEDDVNAGVTDTPAGDPGHRKPTNSGGSPANPTAQYDWLSDDLTNHPDVPIVVFTHQARYARMGQHPTSDSDMEANNPYWALLISHGGVEVVVCGHTHDYERWQRMAAGLPGSADPTNGIREIRLPSARPRTQDPDTNDPQPEVFVDCNDNPIGVLRLELFSDHWTWEMLAPASLATTPNQLTGTYTLVTDSGSQDSRMTLAGGMSAVGWIDLVSEPETLPVDGSSSTVSHGDGSVSIPAAGGQASLRAGVTEYASAASEATCTPSLPSGWQTGDVVYIGVELRISSGNINTPTDWYAVAPSFVSGSNASTKLAVFRRVMQDGDSAPQISNSAAGAGRYAVTEVAVQNADNATPEDGVTVITYDDGATADQTITGQSITPASSNDLLLVFFGAGSTTNVSVTDYSDPSGMTVAGHAGSNVSGSSNASVAVASETLTSNSPTGSKQTTTTTNPSSQNVNGQSVTLVVKSSGTGGQVLGVAGSSATSSTGSGTVVLTAALNGSSATPSHGDGSLIQTMAVSGTAATVSHGDGAVTRVTPVAGSSATTSHGDGTIGLIATINGSSSTVSHGDGSLTRVTPVAGSSATTSHGDGAVSISSGPVIWSVTGSSDTVSHGDGTIKMTGVISGSSATISHGDGSISMRWGISGSSATVSHGDGAVWRSTPVSGSSATISHGDGVIAMTVMVNGSSITVSHGDGDVSRAYPLNGSSDTISHADGAITIHVGEVTWPVYGTAVNSSHGDGVITLLGYLAGSSVTTTIGTGSVWEIGWLTGLSATVSQGTGYLGLLAAISGVSITQSLAMGNVYIPGKLPPHVDGVITVNYLGGRIAVNTLGGTIAVEIIEAVVSGVHDA